MTNFVVATNEFRGNGAPERTECHNLVAWDRLAEICGQFLSKGSWRASLRHLTAYVWEEPRESVRTTLRNGSIYNGAGADQAPHQLVSRPDARGSEPPAALPERAF